MGEDLSLKAFQYAASTQVAWVAADSAYIAFVTRQHRAALWLLVPMLLVVPVIVRA